MGAFAAALPAIAAGGAQVASSLITAGSARRQQKRQNAHNLDLWHMQNEYNSPQAQMKRFQEAGLNPNLVYGQSAGGAAGQASELRSVDMDPQAFRPIDPQGLMQTLNQYYDFDVKQAQAQKLQADTQVRQEEAILRAQQSYGEGIRNARTKFDLNLVEELRENSIDAARANLQKMRADTQYTLNQDERAYVATATNVAEAIERIASSRLGRQLTRQQINALTHDIEVKKLDARMAQMGIRPSDPFYARAVLGLYSKMEHRLNPSINAYHYYKNRINSQPFLNNIRK